MLAGAGRSVTLWARDADTVSAINQQHRNPRYLPDVALASNLVATTEMAKAAAANVVLAVTPAQQFGNLCVALAKLMEANATLVMCSKGIDQNSGKLLSQLARDGLPGQSLAVLSGPSFAVDVARNLPTAVTLAADTLDQARALAKILSAPHFRIYACDDIIGAELGGALKNVLALAVGAVRGMQLGASAEAALIARGFAEISRIAVGFGADPQTLSGLSGLGDLVLTCSSPQSRNFSYGMALGRKEDLGNLPLAEGVYTAQIAARIARERGIDAPIIAMVSHVLSGSTGIEKAVASLLARPLKTERE